MMSAAVLAGGKSSRIGTDKAFLDYAGKTFISLITDELLKITDDVIVAIGRKDKSDFESLLRDRRIRIMNDTYYLENPIGGMLSTFEWLRYKYAFVIACDSPLIHKDLVEHLYFKALSYSAAIPVWDETDPMTCEPLCAVYEVEETKVRINQAVRSGTMGCKRVISTL
jgi:molybdopterin-guanine dinucleotide biosynthesis protein A